MNCSYVKVFVDNIIAFDESSILRPKIAERKGLEPTSQYLDVIDVTVPTITRVAHRVTELYCFVFDELCLTNIVVF